MRARAYVSFLLLVLFMAIAPAQAKNVEALGRSTITCSIWEADRASNPAQATVDEEYVDGFLTGMENMYGLAHNKTVAFDPITNIFRWVDNDCLAHPNKILLYAAADFWFHSGAVRVTP